MLPISLGIVSYRSPCTLASTLHACHVHGLLDAVEERRIILQQPSEDQVTWATSFGFKVIVSEENMGAGWAIRELIDRCSAEHFLLLEEDWELIERQEVVLAQLNAGLQLLAAEPEGVVRYRHRREYGEPLYSLQFSGEELKHPQHIGECIFWRKDPDLDFPDFIQKVRVADQEFYRVSSRHSCYTNNPVLYQTKFAQRILRPFCFEDLEKPIQPWWQEQNFTVFHGNGLFKHNRLDR